MGRHGTPTKYFNVLMEPYLVFNLFDSKWQDK